ncbi:MAG: isoleucine--tRNA ligase [Coriobacteriales bacterium]|jgi:isoleucyl-tRNA synthetase|nr:isoleucine--tRNA ligase [Coriobacteriales bacterium]
MNLPQTDFPMRAGLTQSEPKRLDKWKEMDLYHQVVAKNEGNEPFVLHDGPPYANGPIHMGHVFNKVLKDIVVKYHSQRGYYSPYVPGWDCHGQPIEHRVEVTLGPEKMARINQPTLRRLCREYAEKYVNIQRDGFIRLGVLGDWDDPYLTYAHSYEAGNVEIFKQMYETGAIYRGRKPIHWCAHCHTALAEAEIEYGDEQSPSIYVAFKVLESQNAALAALTGSNELLDAWILIWTTTPWTLPANTGVTLADGAHYVLLELEGNKNFAGKKLLVAEDLVEQVVAELGAEGYALCKSTDGQTPWRAKGRDLLGLTYAHPIHDDRCGRVVTGAHVELSTGTGAVHTAPGHGQEDYLMGQEYGLELLMPVDDNGVFDKGGGPFAGMPVKEANPTIINWLDERGSLIGQKSITHSYPHCWRCHNPVIFRATYQWFVSMDATGIRAKALAEIGKLNWYPTWASNRMRAMVEDRPDWCISRQRSWGVPLPVFSCGNCGEIVATPATFDAVIALFEREGADSWFTLSPSEYLPADTTCTVCGADVHQLIPEKDILDVWWESGVSHTSVLRKRDYLGAPAELYLEGSDQHRGWFQSSLLTSVGAYGAAPFKGIMSCGFITDGEGYKMSKSRGNVVDPAEVMEKFGADVLRLWVGSIDSSTDAGIDDEIIQRTSESYRRIRNSLRFLLSNLYDFDMSTDVVSYDDLRALDRWALVRVQALLNKVTAAYGEFRFHVAYHAIYDFIIRDLSAVYMDALKDRLYSDAPKSIERRSAQTVLANILEVLVRVLAPIWSFTCDEVWDYYPEGICEPDRAQAIALAGWPEATDFDPQVTAAEQARIADEFITVLDVREAVTKALEESAFTKSQQASLVITAPAGIIEVLKAQGEQLLTELFIVAEVELVAGEGTEVTVEVNAASGEKCPRCWNYRELGVDAAHPEVCERCAAVLTGLGL